MKKALQVAHFRADLSLPDGAAGRGAREARARSFFHCFAEFFRVDLRGPAASLRGLLFGGLRKRVPKTLGGDRRGLGKRPRSEPQPARSLLSETRADLALELAELERPGG